ncbi:MmyB family transcriptional regulator [Nocardia pseudovaccinii]|uniref:MmyB family transcriptional regulator n=1 Tax=Nocardia pseudovaccinii TaxID=189540 RepID=UPI000A471DAD|nr:hypothetical protein [Nocardia pseudovaccinii]
MAVDTRAKYGRFMKQRRTKHPIYKSLPKFMDAYQALLDVKMESEPDEGYETLPRSQSSFEKYEAGKTQPSPTVVELTLEVLGTSYWYIPKITAQLFPAVQKRFGQLPSEPTRDHIKLLEAIGTGAAYLSKPMWNLRWANPAFLAPFQGLEIGMNVAEWMLKSPVARAAVVNWETRTHLLFASIANIAVDIQPDEEIEEFKSRFAAPKYKTDFDHFWHNDMSEKDALDTDMFVRVEDGTIDGTQMRIITQTSELIHVPTGYDLYITAIDNEWEPPSATSSLHLPR